MSEEDKIERLVEERNQLEESLHEIEERYQALIETNFYGIQEIDIYGNIIYMNSIQYQILGYEEGDLRGHQIWDLLASDDDRNELTDYLTKIALGEFAPFPWIGKYMRNDGRIVELQIDWKCRWGSQDSVTGFVSIISGMVDDEGTAIRFLPLEPKEKALESDEEGIDITPSNLDMLEEYLQSNIPPMPDEDIGTSLKPFLSGIEDQLNRLHEEFQSKLKYDAHKDKMIDKLHKELQEYKGDILKKYLKSMTMDLIQTTDNIRKLAGYYNSKDPSENDPAKLLELLKAIPSDLDDLFFRQGINTYTCEGDEFEASRQKVLKTCETSDPFRDKKIAESLRPGYEWDDQVIRPEMVAVYVYKADGETD